MLSLVYTALHRERIANLVTLTTPVDFHTPDNLLSKWVRQVDTRLIEASGNIPGEVLNALFLALMPFRLTQQKYVRLLSGSADQQAIEDFVRMEKWIFDSPPQAAVALAQFVQVVLPGEPPDPRHARDRRPPGESRATSASRCSTSTRSRITSCRRQPRRCSGTASAAATTVPAPSPPGTSACT